MPSLRTTPPEPGTYRFVLQYQRFVAVPGQTHPIRLQGYDEGHESIGVALPGEPMRHTVFCRHQTTINRALKDGWTDRTADWLAYLESLRPKLSTTAQVAVYGVLTEDWQTKGDIVQASGITDSEWRTTVKLLEDRGIVEMNHGPRARKTASNRSFRYKRGPRYDEALNITEAPHDG